MTTFLVSYRIDISTSGHQVNFVALVDSQFTASGITMPDINPADNWLNWRRDFEDEFDLVLEPTPANNKPSIALNTPQTYNFTVSNNSQLSIPSTTLSLAISPTGTANLSNIQISNITPAVSSGTTGGQITIDWQVAALEPGATANFSFDASIISVATGGNFGFEIDARIDSIAGESDFSNNRRTWQTTGDVSSDLAVLSVTPDNLTPNPGESVNFAINYANLGTLPKDSAWLRAVISATPDVPVFHLTNSDNASQNGDTLSWLISPLPARDNSGAQGTRNLTIIFDNVTAEGRYQIEVYAEIDTHGVFDDTQNNSNRGAVELAALPHLSLSTIELSGSLQESENLSYAFSIHNSGNFPARDMQLAIDIPQATEFRTMLAAGQSATPQASGTRYLLPIAEIAAGATISYTVGVQVFERVELLRQFQHGSNISLDFTATLTDGEVVLEQRHNTGLGIPRIEESFYLTRNIFRPTVHKDVSFTYDMVADTEVTFKIYNMAGELVREFTPASGIIGRRVRMVWNGRNNENELVGSGLYFIFAEVKGSSNRPMQKLIVVR